MRQHLAQPQLPVSHPETRMLMDQSTRALIFHLHVAQPFEVSSRSPHRCMCGHACHHMAWTWAARCAWAVHNNPDGQAARRTASSIVSEVARRRVASRRAPARLADRHTHPAADLHAKAQRSTLVETRHRHCKLAPAPQLYCISEAEALHLRAGRRARAALGAAAPAAARRTGEEGHHTEAARVPPQAARPARCCRRCRWLPSQAPRAPAHSPRLRMAHSFISNHHGQGHDPSRDRIKHAGSCTSSSICAACVWLQCVALTLRRLRNGQGLQM